MFANDRETSHSIKNRHFILPFPPHARNHVIAAEEFDCFPFSSLRSRYAVYCFDNNSLNASLLVFLFFFLLFSFHSFTRLSKNIRRDDVDATKKEEKNEILCSQLSRHLDARLIYSHERIKIVVMPDYRTNRLNRHSFSSNYLQFDNIKKMIEYAVIKTS